MIGFYQYLSTSIQQFQLQTDVANHTPLQHVGIVFLVHAPKTGVVKGHTSVKNESCRGGTQKVSYRSNRARRFILCGHNQVMCCREWISRPFVDQSDTSTTRCWVQRFFPTRFQEIRNHNLFRSCLYKILWKSSYIYYISYFYILPVLIHRYSYITVNKLWKHHCLPIVLKVPQNL